MERLEKQMQFIIEVDKVKNIFRQTYLADGNRKENDAEHSWHLALMAVLLKEYSNEEVSLEKVIPMVLIMILWKLTQEIPMPMTRPERQPRRSERGRLRNGSLDCFRRIREAGSGRFGKSLKHMRHRRQNLPMCLITVSRFF